MLLSNEPTFDAPLPGMSLTHELGGRPWQQPAQFTSVDEVIEYYMSRMTSEEFMLQLVDVLEMGVPVTVLANTMQMASAMEGVHSLDTGMLVLPVLIEMIMLLGDSAGIEYTSGLEDPDTGKTRESLLAKYASKYKKQLDDIDIQEAMDEAPEEDNEPTGLMARRK